MLKKAHSVLKQILRFLGLAPRRCWLCCGKSQKNLCDRCEEAVGHLAKQIETEEDRRILDLMLKMDNVEV